ncbi:tetratricopeptide repeat protein [Actinoplanes sp. NPDC051851]|uniref:tetratricopeptide repeat protein n=1 Tax=Actinoplanes sp. NPDC051851 TaxID=3154753 RepID=UPI0034309BEC
MDKPQTLHTLDTSTLRTPAFAVPERAAAVDLGEELARARREHRREEAVPALRVFEDGETPLSLTFASYEDGLIEDAKANIAAGGVDLALAQLDEVLGTQPGHPEARYLRSYCLLSLGRETEALTALEALRAEGAPPELAERVRDLRTTLRGRLTGRLLDGQDAEAIAAYLRLVPEEGACWRALALLRAVGGDPEGAVAAAETGAGAADTAADREELARLAYRIRLLVLRTVSPRIAEMLHRGSYAAALDALRGLGPEWNRFEPVGDLAGYIVRLGRTGPGRPDLPADRADVLHDLLTGRDVEVAGDLLDRGQPEQGVALMRRAARLAPADPTTHFVLGICLLTTGGDLAEAETAARVAADDGRIPSARDLLDVIGLRRLDQAAVRVQKSLGDINACPPDRLQAAVTRTRGLRDEARGMLTSAGELVRAPLQSLTGVLAENAVQLELVLLVSTFNQLAGAGPRRGTRDTMDRIVQRCRALRRETRVPDTLRLLGELEQAARTVRERS